MFSGDGVWNWFIKIVLVEGVCAGGVYHESCVVCGAQEFIVS